MMRRFTASLSQEFFHFFDDFALNENTSLVVFNEGFGKLKRRPYSLQKHVDQFQLQDNFLVEYLLYFIDD